MSRTKTAFYLESTTIKAEQSANEISIELVKAGARRISTEYGDNRCISGMRWVLLVGKKEIHFALPARIQPVYQLLCDRANGQMGVNKKAILKAKAERIAWRQLLAWVKIQNVMIQTGMAEVDEIYMPYAVEPSTGRTLFQAWRAQLALPAPE
jgi:hypothetical protein